MDGHYQLKTLRPDLSQEDRSAVIASLAKGAYPKTSSSTTGWDAKRRSSTPSAQL